MNLIYEVIPDDKIEYCRDLCNELMAFQKSKAHITPELFDNMNFDTRMIPSVKKAIHNYTVVVKDDEKIVAYVYSNISPKETYSNDFATFFDLLSVSKQNVGCLSQFYIKEEYRQYGIGSKLFKLSMEWLKQFDDVEDYFIFVSNGNHEALEFYQRKGFSVSHDILDGFITVLRLAEPNKN
ncbi:MULTISPECIES: GNAT family N-acetyltransferase [unclassified Bacillus (in: firmicutes)]|uniref:GNAT family N-acetyltransferase n=1 Tax=unclassified Bacillus (in: firmicutes) TaxID=185979 RepID=UPI0008DFCA04|nr:MULTISPECIES: GNAT family N-acetyltransferase [unclassified Bacillus (in: firmicutes)]SFB07026.1 Acetyltransferase (GNAT) family protein [Bacillus sp. UNCCL13]SFQ87492.1 Acetyltransferase (GNAT) family protein [Bacillus sp. cl95]